MPSSEPVVISSEQAEAIMDLKGAMGTLVRQLADLQKAITRAVGPAWFADTEWITPEQDPTRFLKAIKCLTQLHNEDGWAPLQAGLLYCPPAAAPLVKDINNQKQEIRSIIERVREGASKGSTVATLSGYCNEQHPHLKEALSRLCLTRLNLLWTYRKIHLLPAGLESVSWLWSHTTSIKRLSIGECIELTNQLDGNNRDLALRTLGQLPPNTTLAQVKPVKEHLRANLKWQNPETKKVERRMVTAPTVLLYQEQEQPFTRWPDPGHQGKRRGRSDRKIYEEPLIKALRLHAYMENTQ